MLLGHEDILGEIPPPPHLSEMIAAAETLGREFVFVRADFFDRQLGRLWRMQRRKRSRPLGAVRVEA